MHHPDPDYEYREKWGRLGMEIEMLILDVILSAVERLNVKRDQAETVNQPKIEPF